MAAQLTWSLSVNKMAAVAKIIRSKCKQPFEGNNRETFVTGGAATAPGVTAGAMFGVGYGLVGEPIGGDFGYRADGIVGWLAADQFRRSSKCGRLRHDPTRKM